MEICAPKRERAEAKEAGMSMTKAGTSGAPDAAPHSPPSSKETDFTKTVVDGHGSLPPPKRSLEGDSTGSLRAASSQCSTRNSKGPRDPRLEAKQARRGSRARSPPSTAARNPSLGVGHPQGCKVV